MFAAFALFVSARRCIAKRTANVAAAAERIFLTDGHMNFAINVGGFHRDTLITEGIGHIGFLVDDADATYRRAEQAGAMGVFPVASGSYAEGHINDPIGVRVDVSEGGFAVEAPDDVYVNPLPRRR